ncbi:NAD dependent epimerase/dehydratase [Penicillium canariense]|uniref:NAD dependent epimerase/dehydratase n=1 Tax=Penicillium canariense TaxID=189055 RepID=A0A9W9I7L7_9EURO|nr:NAD dependent epimerase/dehydratase [Penicillium canariense]KAJ5167272.1 NAD dependent epimerase/dehydratase [Penicillium canariense]
MGQKSSVPQPGTKFQVIGAGLPRTGTASFSRALEILCDGPVFHCGTQATLGPTIQIKQWMEILRRWLAGTDSDREIMFQTLQSQLDGYAAVTDSPGSQFVPELMELYPDAKVICTVRDAISWEKSMDQVRNATVPWYLHLVLLPLPGLRYFIPYLHLLAAQWEKLYSEAIPTRQSYHRHIAWLKEVVPEDRLVFFEVKDGWEPLCKALGRDIPKDQPFPHINDSDAIAAISKMHIQRGLTRWAAILAVGAAAVAWAVRT